MRILLLKIRKAKPMLLRPEEGQFRSIITGWEFMQKYLTENFRDFTEQSSSVIMIH
jgi:hypothetical protein